MSILILLSLSFIEIIRGQSNDISGSGSADLSSYSNSGGLCISTIVPGYKRMYLVHNGDKVSLDYSCSAVWFIDHIYPSNDPDKLCSGRACRIIKNKPGQVGRAPKAMTLTNDITPLSDTEGRFSWFILFDNKFDPEDPTNKQLFNAHRDSINQNSLLCGALTVGGGRLLWEKSTVDFCGWRIEPSNIKPTPKPTPRPTPKPTPAPTSAAKGLCISTIVPGYKRMYLVHNGDKGKVSLDYSCSAVWFIDHIYPSFDPDNLCSGGVCRIIKNKPGKVGPAPNAMTLTNNITPLSNTEGRGSWFILDFKNEFDPQDPTNIKLFNAHRHSMNENSLLCGAITGGGGRLLWEKSTVHFCGWRIELY
jgi:hypothetical protein